MNHQTEGKRSLIENLLYLLDEKTDYTLQWSDGLSTELCARLKEQNILAVNQLKKFLDSIPGGFFIYRAEGNQDILYANKAMIRVLNCDTIEEFREVTGNSFRGIVHPDDYEAVERSIREQISVSQFDLDYVEYRVIPKGGGIRWIEDYGHFVHSDTEGDIFYVFIGDATDKKRRQWEETEQLKQENYQARQRLQSRIDRYSQELEGITQEHLRRLEIIEGLSIDYEGIFYVDLDEDLIRPYRLSDRFKERFSWSGSLREYFGCADYYIGHWVHPEDRELFRGFVAPDRIRQRLAEERSIHINYRTLHGGKNEYRQLRVVNVGSEEHISQFVMGYRDVDDEIVEEVKRNEMLAEALNTAKRANNAKNLFLSNMSHDIRTPMNAILGFNELAKKNLGDPEKLSGYLDMIASSSEQLMQLLNNVLDIARIESGNVSVESEECNLMDIVHQVQTLILPQAAAKGIKLSLDIAQLKYVNVYADAGKLSRILTYFADNAVKYSREAGWVSLAIVQQREARNGYATYRFTVEDNGVGINESFLQHIFEPFEREKNTTLSGIAGSGLGLTIAKDLVELMGGTIDVESTVGQGSKFSLTLPLHICEGNRERIPESEDEPHTFTTPKRILIVDDNEINLEIENEVLKDANFLVDTASDGQIAVEKVKNAPEGYYDLILMDIQMPVMDGYHATRAIRRIENPALANIPIIAVSANAFDEDRKNAVESGMNAHLAKPLDTAQLYKLIRRFLQNVENSTG